MGYLIPKHLYLTMLLNGLSGTSFRQVLAHFWLSSILKMLFATFRFALLIGIIWVFFGRTNFIIASSLPSVCVLHHTFSTSSRKPSTGSSNVISQPTFATIWTISFCSLLLLPHHIDAQQQSNG